MTTEPTPDEAKAIEDTVSADRASRLKAARSASRPRPIDCAPPSCLEVTEGSLLILRQNTSAQPCPPPSHSYSTAKTTLSSKQPYQPQKSGNGYPRHPRRKTLACFSLPARQLPVQLMALRHRAGNTLARHPQRRGLFHHQQLCLVVPRRHEEACRGLGRKRRRTKQYPAER